MKMVNMHEAKTHLSRLIDRIASDGGVIIARAGKPVAKLVPLTAAEGVAGKRLGFMTGQMHVPADFDRMGEGEIEALFGSQP